MPWEEIDHDLSWDLIEGGSPQRYFDTWVEPDEFTNLVIVCDAFASRCYVRSMEGEVVDIPKPSFFRAIYFHTVQLP